MPPRVSVVLPVKNGAATLDAALESIVAQTFSDFELIVVDHASTDATPRVLEGWARRDARIHLHRCERPGLAHALNAGLQVATAPLLARMDCDDLAYPERFARQVAALEAEPDLTGLGTAVEIFRDDRPVSPNLQRYAHWLNSLTTPEALCRERYLESPLCHPSVMIRTDALVAHGGWREGPWPEDYDLWLRMLEAGQQLRTLPEVLLRWRDHVDRFTRHDPRCHWRALVALKAEHLARRFSQTPLILGGAGRIGRALLRELTLRGCSVQAVLEVNPRRVGQRVQGVPMVPWSQVGPPAGRHLLAAVGSWGAREEIRRALHAESWREGPDFTVVA